MLFTIVALVVMGLTSGLLLLHWLALGFISLAMSMVYLVLTRWDALLLPKWLAMLAVFQMAYLAGSAIRVWWDHATEERT